MNKVKIYRVAYELTLADPKLSKGLMQFFHVHMVNFTRKPQQTYRVSAEPP